ncbi:MAG: Holliday junction branch migration protein RuvA [Dermatophilaceae bacterium]
MIASVRGPVVHVGLDRAVVEVGGVGLLVHMTPATAASLGGGADAVLATSLVVREDSLTLYGFAGAAERDMFETVQTVSGIGPRLALAMLSVLPPADLRRAVAGNDLATLTKVPGVGRKGAERIVLELRDKLGTVDEPPTGPAAASSAGQEQVVEALVGLGWSVKASSDAVDAVRASAAAPAAVADLLRAALRELGGR